MKKILVLLVTLSILVSCGSRKRNTTPTSKNSTTEVESTIKEPTKSIEEEPIVEQEVVAPRVILTTADYIEVYGPIAVEEMKFYHIPASITLAQGILESGSGKGRLSVEANNHFGIKCHDWTGAKIHHDDDADQECFRKYNDAKYSYRDHSLFLSERKRYSGLFDLNINDYKGWAKGLRAAGYATDRKYPEKLISLIERYKLYTYDEQVTGSKPNRKQVKSIKNKHFVVKGDTLYSISRRYNISVQELKNINGLQDTNLSIGQELLVKS